MNTQPIPNNTLIPGRQWYEVTKRNVDDANRIDFNKSQFDVTEHNGMKTVNLAQKNSNKVYIPGQAIPCKITSGNSVEGYQVDLYGDGLDKSVTDTGILYILEVSALSHLAVGSFVLGFAGTTLVTGGNE